MKYSKIYVGALLACLMLIGGVFSTWNYAIVPAQEIKNDIEIGMGFAPDYTSGENHNEVFEKIENALEKSDSSLNTNIKDRITDEGFLSTHHYSRPTFGNMAVTNGESVGESVLGTEDAAKIEFIVWSVKEENGEIVSAESYDEIKYFYVFTTGHDLGDKAKLNWLSTSRTTNGDHYFVDNNNDGKGIDGNGTDEDSMISNSLTAAQNKKYADVLWVCCIYRTIFTNVGTKEDGSIDWKPGIIECGRAPADWYDESRSSNIHLTQIPCFAQEYWQASSEINSVHPNHQ